MDQRIMRLLCEGHQHNEIALMTGMKRKSVSERINRIRDKLGARTTVEAAVIWTRGYTTETSLKKMLMNLAEGLADDCE